MGHRALLLVVSFVVVIMVHVFLPGRFLEYDSLDTFTYPNEASNKTKETWNNSNQNENPNGRRRKCKLYEDTYGSWVLVEDAKNINASFFGGDGPGHALRYTKIWIPNDCAYHRFTKKTLDICVDFELMRRQAKLNESIAVVNAFNYALMHSNDTGIEATKEDQHPEKNKKMKKKKPPKPLPHDSLFEINLMGDSALRGITCGITRILEGDEYEGPCDNVICGGTGHPHPLSAGNAFGHPFSIAYGPALKLTFTYVKTFVYQHFDWLLEWEVTANQPNVLIMNTGAWDFDTIARDMNAKGLTATDHCLWPNQTLVSHQRASQFVNNTIIHELGDIGKMNNVRLIYRGNHYNERFGPSCADDELVALLHASNSHWEVWDNKNISRDVWKKQTWDGFHFDRHQIHSTEQHLYNVAVWEGRGGEKPGALEMQLAQSLLNAIFHDCLEQIF